MFDLHAWYPRAVAMKLLPVPDGPVDYRLVTVTACHGRLKALRARTRVHESFLRKYRHSVIIDRFYIVNQRDTL